MSVLNIKYKGGSRHFLFAIWRNDNGWNKRNNAKTS